jgi:filamentous hemagglutinin family protein
MRLVLALAVGAGLPATQANPVGGTVTRGTATFTPSGSLLTIQTSDQAVINWQSFNIGLGETTTFLQPSATSIVWNRINDVNPSQILGNLNANGYVVLQNQSGFFIGGQAAISTHGLLMTTAPTPVPDLSAGGPWTFNALPPSASIINYGQITLNQGGSVFLIAHDIQNQGTITAPGGNIGLFAGQEVLVSDRPDGRGLSARVVLPEGSVNNTGSLIADAGSIAMRAQVVNQGGLVQANSVKDVNGVIELVASDTLTLSDSSVISAQGDSTATAASPGGFVILKAGNTYADTPASTISLTGQRRGQNGILELFCPGADASVIQSTLDNPFALLVNPYDITISLDATDTSSSNPTFNVRDLLKYANVRLEAGDNIELMTRLTLANRDTFGTLALEAANNITLDDGAAISAGRNWDVRLTAGTQLAAAADRQAGSDGIYLLGNAFVQAQNGTIDLWAGNEMLVNTGDSGDVGNNGIRTLAGGSINVTTLFGDVNTGGNPRGFRTPYRANSPFYSVLNTLGGVSTVAGGNVNIDAGGNVISYLPSGSDPLAASDGGSGAFGPQAGNVSVKAGGSVYGHFVVANGTGTINAGQDAGGSDPSQNLALSLIKGSWSVNAPNGNINLQEVRNPNGVFNAGGNNPNAAGYHLFDYDPHASVSLNAGNGVYLNGLDLPRTTDPAPPMIFPPSLDITAGPGGIVLGDSIILFPSPFGNLHITDAGRFEGVPNNAQLNPTPALIMSDSSQRRWTDPDTFGMRDHGATPIQMNNPDPVTIDVGGDMRNLILMTTKRTAITVGGNMEECSFSGENLHAGDVTSINVAGRIYNQSPYSFTYLTRPIPLVPPADLPPNTRALWDTIFGLALDPARLATLHVPPNQTAAQLAGLLSTAALFQTRPGFFYNPATGRLGFSGPMSDAVRAALEQPVTVVRYGPDGLPVVDAHGHFVTDRISWGVAVAAIETLYQASAGAPSASSVSGLGYEVGGPGQFNVHAGSISLGNVYGIMTTGVGDKQGNGRFANLAPYTPVGATLNVTVDGNLEMSASTIAALGGGSVNVTSTGGSMTLGSQDLADLQQQIVSSHGMALGIYTSGLGNVNVTALGDINIESSRIASYNGGNISVKSLEGNVNAGNGGSMLTPIVTYYVDARTGLASQFRESVFGSGIIATTLADPSQVPGSPRLPGNITVETPRGDIVANQGGILQTVTNGKLLPGPTITLVAGTMPSDGSPGYAGNIELGNSGVIGGTVNLQANGNITGLVISRQDSTINAARSFSGTVLSGGTANLSAGGTISGIIIGVGGVNASGGAGVTATVLSQNAAVNGGQSESTLGTTAATSAVSRSASQEANTEAKQQVASGESQADDDKKKVRKPVLTKRSRVTVVLPKA